MSSRVVLSFVHIPQVVPWVQRLGVLWCFLSPLAFKFLAFACEIGISLCNVSKLKLLICVCNLLRVRLALSVVCDHMLHAYQRCSILQSSALA